MVFSRLAVSVPLDSGGVATSTHTPSEGAYAEFSPIRSRPQSGESAMRDFERVGAHLGVSCARGVRACVCV